MCSKEIGILSFFLLLVIGAFSRMVSWAGLFFWLTPGRVPAKSALASFDWDPVYAKREVTKEMLNSWEADGFAVVREAVDPRAIKLLLEEAERLCKKQFWVSPVCQIEEGRWQSDLIRDFLFHSNVSEIAAKLLKLPDEPALRVFQDGIVGVSSTWLQPLFFTYTKHVDHGGMPGVWHGLHSDTEGVGLWIPLNDIEPDVTGGGIELYPGFPLAGCQFAAGERSTVEGFDLNINRSKVFQVCESYMADNATVKPAVKPGDVVAWLPQMLHKTQRVKESGFRRYALYVRVITNETVSCARKACGWKARPCCSGTLPKSGMVISTPCYPQVWPTFVESELKAHFGRKPEPMIDRRWREGQQDSDLVVHDVCKRHRQGGPKPFWKELVNKMPSAEDARPPTVNATIFDCQHADHEGVCWRLNDADVDLSLVPWYMRNYTRVGVPLYFSKDLLDIEWVYRIPWGATVRAVEEDADWLRAGDYYVYRGLANGKFIPLDDLEAPPPGDLPAAESPAEGSKPPTRAEL